MDESHIIQAELDNRFRDGDLPIECASIFDKVKLERSRSTTGAPPAR